MANIVTYSENTNTRRFASKMMKPKKNAKAPKGLKSILVKQSDRSKGRVTVRGQGGRQKRYYREVDFKRNKIGIEGVVEALEYDPNRNVNLALINYPDGDKRYILAPQGLKAGDKVLAANDRIEL